MRRAFQEQMWAGPHMMLAGSCSRSHPGAPRTTTACIARADGVDEVRKAVREQLKGGADLIKMLATGAVLDERGNPRRGRVQPRRDAGCGGRARKFGKSCRRTRTASTASATP